MKATALILTDGLLDQVASKTAHGLILDDSRYTILGVIDKEQAGLDAGFVISNKPKNIPVFRTISQALSTLEAKPNYCIIGVAPIGGRLSETLVQTIKEAIHAGLSIVNGLHSLLSLHPEVAPLAKEKGVQLIDIRKPKLASELRMWSGKIASVKVPRIAVIGTDCAIGKRTTATRLLHLCQSANIKADLIYTGQTGWLQNRTYGFILDSTLNDFVAGEMEDQILRCVRETSPDLIFIEGQSALRNPSGPCGAELLLSAGAKYVILQHNPMRKYFAADGGQTFKIPSLLEEIELIQYYGAKVIAITLNATGLASEDMPMIQEEIQIKTNLPAIYPHEDGVQTLLPLLQDIIQNENNRYSSQAAIF